MRRCIVKLLRAIVDFVDNWADKYDYELHEELRKSMADPQTLLITSVEVGDEANRYWNTPEP